MSEPQFFQREKRFEVESSKDFDVIVSRGESDENLYFADLLDFSRSGLKFRLPFSAKFDEMLRIRLTFRNSELGYHGKGRVRHIRNTDVNRWVVGCSLAPHLPDEVIHFLAAATRQERRRSPRLEVQGTGFLSRQGRMEETPAAIQNLSEGGFCLIVLEEQEIGSQVNFTILNRFGFQEQIDARIRWQKQHEEGYLVGLTFASRESYEKLVDCLDLPNKNGGLDADLLDWKVVTCAMIAMLLPSVSYVLLGASFGSSSDDVSQSVKPQAVEVQPVVDPPPTHQVEVVDQGEASKVETEDAAPEVQPQAVTPATSTKKTESPPAKKSLDIWPPSVLTTNQAIKPRRLRSATESSRTKQVEDAQDAVQIGNDVTNSATRGIQQSKSSTRRVDRDPGIIVPSETIPDGRLN